MYKYLTFSYDDGVTQDIRLIELFNKYGMKATFNINSQLLGKKNELVRDYVKIDHNKIGREDLRYVYEGHEVAAHTLTHQKLTCLLNENEIIHQVENDRINLSELCGYEVVGMAYPCGGVNYNTYVAETIRRNTGIKYARTIVSSKDFSFQNNLYEFKPTIYHHEEFDEMIRLGKKFIELNADSPKLFYIWGHAYEFDINNSWKRFEEFLEMMSGRNDICYCTNRDVLLKSELSVSLE